MQTTADLAAVVLTVKLAGLTMVLLLCIGTPIAWWLARTRSRLKNVVGAVVTLPLVLPPAVLGFYLLVMLGPEGPLGRTTQALGLGLLPFTFPGLVVASVIYSLPFVVQPLQQAFAAMGEAPMEAAATLRASPLNAFFTVAMPMARPGYITAAVLGFAHTVGEFGVVLMIGGNIPGKTQVLSMAIYNHVEALEYAHAHWLAGGMLGFSFLVLWLLYSQGWAQPMNIAARFRLSYPGFTLDLDLNLPGSGVTALFGVSGCGKTTLLRCIAGLTRADQGRLVVDGETWQDDTDFLPTHRRPLGYVFQEANLFPHLSVRGNLDYGRSRVAGSASRISVNHAIRLLGIDHLLDRMPAGLSGGERQRTAIARALLTRPRLLLLDEPLAGLDQARKNEFLPYLERLRDELEIPIIYVSHAHDEVARLADHIVVMEAGRALAAGPLTETLARLDLPLQLGEDAGVVLDAVVAERDETWHLARLEFSGGSLWVRDPGNPPGHRVRVRILASDVSIAREKVSGTSILNCLPATVAELAHESHPALSLLRLDLGPSPLVARITWRSARELGLVPGMSVWVQIKAAAIVG